MAGRGEDEPPPYARAREHMASLVCRLPPRDRQPERTLGLIEKPALTYTDPARENSDGSVWVWPAKGRPRAIVELFSSFQDTQWMHAITLTSDELVELDVPGGQQWRPKTSGLTWTALSDAPAESAPARLRQMKALARRFRTHEFWDPDNSRYELRLLVSPIYRYADEEVLDGGLFAYVHGTNPEIVLILESPKSDAKPGWRYAFARLGSAEMHAELDGKDVWTVPRAAGVVGQPVDPYWMFWTNDRRP
jgi:hypothetical protein